MVPNTLTNGLQNSSSWPGILIGWFQVHAILRRLSTATNVSAFQSILETATLQRGSPDIDYRRLHPEILQLDDPG